MEVYSEEMFHILANSHCLAILKVYFIEIFGIVLAN